MTRTSPQSQHSACEVYDVDSEAYVNCCLQELANKQGANQTQLDGEKAHTKVGPQFSEVLWECALKRHCDSRQNIRNLLDRYIKPHH